MQHQRFTMHSIVALNTLRACERKKDSSSRRRLCITAEHEADKYVRQACRETVLGHSLCKVKLLQHRAGLEVVDSKFGLTKHRIHY